MEQYYFNKRILLIEEDTQLLNVLQKYLIDQKAHIFSCSDYNQAYQFMQKENVDHIVCDYKKSNLKAQTLLEKLKQENKILPNMIILTASLQSEMDGHVNEKKSISQTDDKNSNQKLNELLTILKSQNKNAKEILNPHFLKPQSLSLLLFPHSGQPYKGELLEIEAEEFWATTSKELKDPHSIKYVLVEYVMDDQVIKKNLLGHIRSIEQGIYDDHVIIYSIDNRSLNDWSEIYRLRLEKQKELKAFLLKAQGRD